MSTQTLPQHDHAAFAQFERTTSLWGPVTLGLGFLVSLGAALFAAFGTGLGITTGELWKAVGIVAATFGVIAVIEPVSYFPILGRSAMYQAFLIGNIANKLLPSALMAQSDLGEKPGTRRAELIAGAAIVGAVFVHIITLVLFVGLLGTWLLGVLPPGIIAVGRLYILPAVFGAVGVQAMLTIKDVRLIVISGVIAALTVFLVVPLAPATGLFATAIAVVASVAATWIGRRRTGQHVTTPTRGDH